ncbi:LacI family DNA-binding transcriptional regulator (plasmid) [Skermanella mucosa]|uniref:LacI family DNA-binding transcriptional regulator n=1 Tax=Skermanella mucosa TaxID=1789672 RepID=UPI001E3A2759|nr:LacI family DNA-binding transcriptional regulator [Skermanella mucosa]UEM25404.1 LacI family DNA-binding transcriptional regulator [Skermanella mucosa]
MTDVAKAAGVSQSSVSLVLNNMTGARISEATRRRVWEAVRQIGYQFEPRRQEPPPVTGPVTRNLIGYLVDEISTSVHPAVTIDGARDAAWEHGCVLAVSTTRGNAELEEATIRSLVANPALVGIVYSTIFTRKVAVPAVMADVPAVLLNCYAADRAFPSVVPGEVTGGHTATARLIQAGHTRIGFINGEPWMDAARDRFKGYRQALATADLPFDPALVRDGDWAPTSGYEQTRSLMAEPRPPTAIFCANDLMAVGCLEALRDLGLQIPRDVAVMGYDDQEMAQHTRPPLTTVLLPNYEMGRWAVEHLISDVIHGHASRLLQVKLDCPLVERGSVRSLVEEEAVRPAPVPAGGSA